MAEEASLMNVEELLTDFNWKTSGNAAALEKRLLGELHALEAVSTVFIFDDTRILTYFCPRQMYMLLFNRTKELDLLLSKLTRRWRNWRTWKAGCCFTVQSLT